MSFLLVVVNPLRDTKEDSAKKNGLWGATRRIYVGVVTTNWVQFGINNN